MFGFLVEPQFIFRNIRITVVLTKICELLVNMTAPAMRYLLWLSAHENDPSLTEEEIGALVTVVRIEELNELLRLICGMTEAAEGELGGSPTPASQESESSS